MPKGKEQETTTLAPEKSDDELWQEALKTHGLEDAEGGQPAATTPIPAEGQADEGDDNAQQSGDTPIKGAEGTTPAGQAQQSAQQEEKEFYKGKSREELIAMVENGTRKISEQGNAIHQFKTQLDSVQAQVQTIQSSKEQKQEDDILSQYRDEDKEAIRKLIRQERLAETQQQQETSKQERQRAVDENERFWESLQAINPKLAAEIQPKVFDTIRKDPDNTYYKPGWMAQNFRSFIPAQGGNAGQTTPNDGLIRKKVGAATAVGGTSNPSQTSSLKGKPEPSDPDEYVKWLRDNQGISI